MLVTEDKVDFSLRKFKEELIKEREMLEDQLATIQVKRDSPRRYTHRNDNA